MASRSPANRSTTQQAPKKPAFKHAVNEELQETVKRYELIFSATNDVLYDLNLLTTTVVWNEALYTQYGYNRNDASDNLEWWTHHIHPEDALMVENKLTELLESRSKNWQCEYRFRRVDGGYNDVRDRGLILRDTNGKAIRIIGSFLDITRQKQLDAAKDEFISLVSHQLRTPLSVIRFYSEMLTNGMVGDLTPEQLAHIANISGATERLIKVVGDILNVSRLEMNRINIAAVPSDVNQLIAGYVKNVQPLANEKRVTISFQPEKQMPLVAIDDAILDQIVHNLLTNAIRYSKTQTGRVVVRFRATPKGYILSVHDNGIGVPKSAQAQVFNRFYRAKNALNVEAHGTGLGLYIVKLITDAFGGKIWLESQRGKGTTFYVQLPPTGMQVSGDA